MHGNKYHTMNRDQKKLYQEHEVYRGPALNVRALQRVLNQAEVNYGSAPVEVTTEKNETVVTVFRRKPEEVKGELRPEAVREIKPQP